MNETYQKIGFMLENIQTYKDRYNTELRKSGDELRKIFVDVPESNPLRKDLQLYIHALAELGNFFVEGNTQEFVLRKNLLRKLGEAK